MDLPFGRMFRVHKQAHSESAGPLPAVTNEGGIGGAATSFTTAAKVVQLYIKITAGECATEHGLSSDKMARITSECLNMDCPPTTWPESPRLR